jgi:hypothetical protein
VRPFTEQWLKTSVFWKFPKLAQSFGLKSSFQKGLDLGIYNNAILLKQAFGTRIIYINITIPGF